MARARVLQVNHAWGQYARQTDLREKTHQPIIAIDYARQTRCDLQEDRR